MAGHHRRSGSFTSQLLATPSPGAYPTSPSYSPSPSAASHGSSPSAFSHGFAPAAGEAAPHHQGPLLPTGSGRLHLPVAAPQAYPLPGANSNGSPAIPPPASLARASTGSGHLLAPYAPTAGLSPMPTNGAAAAPGGGGADPFSGYAYGAPGRAAHAAPGLPATPGQSPPGQSPLGRDSPSPLQHQVRSA